MYQTKQRTHFIVVHFSERTGRLLSFLFLENGPNVCFTRMLDTESVGFPFPEFFVVLDPRTWKK